MRNTRKWYKVFWRVDGELAFRWKWLRDLYYKKEVQRGEK